MKFVYALLGIVLVLGVTYGLAFLGVIPVASIARHNPSAARVLTAMYLYHPKKVTTTSMIATVPPPIPAEDPLAADRRELDAERAQIAAEKAALEKKPADGDSGTPTSAKMVAIYDTMKPAELAGIFEKLTDAQVCDALIKMDEQKAGKVLVAMPPSRAAKLTTLMNQATGPQNPPQQQSSVATSVP